jgi:hypothetical protein
MKKPKKSLIWITDILKKHHIPYQITGGLAAIAYGATRPLDDIDIDIPDNTFDLILAEVQPYVTYGPERFKSDKWDLMLMTLNYENQAIDLSGADSTYIFNDQTKKWVQLKEDLLHAPLQNIFGLQLPVIPKESLISYKKILAREVDLIDVQQIESVN